MKSYNRLLAFLIGLILAFLVIAGNADAFKVKFINDTKELVYFRFIWGDCDWPGFPKIYPVYTGEIEPGDIINSELDYYRAGKWAIRWKGETGEWKGHTMVIYNSHGVLILKASKAPLFLPGT